MIKTFSILRFRGHDAASAYYQALSDPLFLAKNVIYLAQTTLGDGILVFFLIYPFSPACLPSNCLGLAMLCDQREELENGFTPCVHHFTDVRCVASQGNPPGCFSPNIFDISVGGIVTIIRCSQVKIQGPDVPQDPATIMSYASTLITTIYCTSECLLRSSKSQRLCLMIICPSPRTDPSGHLLVHFAEESSTRIHTSFC